MKTDLRIFLMKLRKDNKETLNDMAMKLGVSAAYLSKIENGIGRPNEDWIALLTEKYELDQEQEAELAKLIFDARNWESINISEYGREKRMLMIDLFRNLRELPQGKIDRIYDVINDTENNGD